MNYRLFQSCGIELEYMVVRKTDLKVLPIVDQLMIRKNGSLTTELMNGKISWSNEFVAHVVELKTNGPTSSLEDAEVAFQRNIQEINELLKEFDAQLLPTAAHPLMQPDRDMQLWAHDNSDVHALYQQIFDCRGHGWGNSQSMHLNIPFHGDTEFERLHAAVRILLPLIPAISASSPILEGDYTGYKDSRMQVYRTTQKEIPQMRGKVIPEQVFNRETYFREIFNPTNEALKPHDKAGILDHHFPNSRGAIARFDRNTIEIRVMDLQECPAADMAVASLVIESLKILAGEELVTLEDQKSWHEDELLAILELVNREAENAWITNERFLAVFDMNEPSSAGDIWKKIYSRVHDQIPDFQKKTIRSLLEQGSLSTRISVVLGQDPSREKIRALYDQLGECLARNEFFLV